MKTHLRILLRPLEILVLATLLLHQSAIHAQQVGHYIGGFTGLENGSTAPPGLYVAVRVKALQIDTFVDATFRLDTRAVRTLLRLCEILHETTVPCPNAVTPKHPRGGSS